MYEVLSIILLLLTIFAGGCNHKENGISIEKKDVTIVFKHGKIAGNPDVLREILKRFEEENPGIKIKDETLPSSTDEQHQFYVINLEGRSNDFDVLSMDVIWIQEFARAGWLKDLSAMIPEGKRGEFFSGPMEAVTYKKRVYAVPWYIDAGLLYYRKDILKKYNLSPPSTWDELVSTASAVMEKEEGLYGFIWQGKQYEGLVCNVLEYIWSNGGDVIRGEDIVIDSPETIEALQFMQDMIYKYRISPELVTTSIEEPTRHIFENGKAIFMRNWPYAWNIFNREGSPVRGKVGVSILPAFKGKKSASTLGGWQLGVNRYSGHPEEAEKFIRFMTSYDIQKVLALTIGYKPTIKALYKDKKLIDAQPFIVGLYDVFTHARPRPVSPLYMMVTQAMQPAFSSVLAKSKTPEDAVRSLRKELESILKIEN
ncbi:MAG: ABC transporter substrate-binding protein [Nitrospirota bacterium]